MPRLDNMVSKLNTNDIEKDDFFMMKSDIENSLDEIYSNDNNEAKGKLD